MRTWVGILDPDTIDASALIAMTPLLTMIYPQNAFYHLYVVYPPNYKHFRDIDSGEIRMTVAPDVWEVLP